MNYSRNLRKVAKVKRILASWVIVAVIFSLAGGVSGYAMKSHITAKYEQKEETQTNEHTQSKMVVFGSYDDRIFTQEAPIEWGDDLDFTPIACDMPEEQQEFTCYLCAGYNLDFTLVMALIGYESNYRADIVSKTNDYGLMQINAANHEWLTESLGVTDFTDPYQNIRAGVFVLRKLFERYQDTSMVLMAYSMGEEGASRLWEKGIYSTEYSQSILTIQEQFNEQLGG